MFKHQEKTATRMQLDEAATICYRQSLGKRWDDPAIKLLEREWQRLRKLAEQATVIGTIEDTLTGRITAALNNFGDTA